MTHPSTAKLIEISNALLTRTKQGRLTWVPTEKPDVFETNFPDYSIRISPEPYKIEIYNNKGRLIESATSYEMKESGEFSDAANISEVLEELHDLARGQALNIDSALDELLSRLSGSNIRQELPS